MEPFRISAANWSAIHVLRESIAEGPLSLCISASCMRTEEEDYYTLLNPLVNSLAQVVNGYNS